jgi:uncharacterized membrane protein YuzA (DUF378 family)
MKTIQKKEIATSFTAILFIIIALSGIMMFFHFFDAQVKELHEILGIGFVIAGLLHVIYNFSSMKRYFSKKIFIVAGLLGVLVSGVFVYNGTQQGENPKMMLIQKTLNAPLETSFALFNVTQESALEKLEKNNLSLKNATTISEIAKANKTSPFTIVSILNAQ